VHPFTNRTVSPHPQLFLLPITGRRLPTSVELGAVDAVGANDEVVLEVGHCAGLQRNHVLLPHRVHHPVVVRLHDGEKARLAKRFSKATRARASRLQAGLASNFFRA
jgi:hypothetical protein